MRRLEYATVAQAAAVTLLVAATVWPFFSPGLLAHRDMLVLDHPALTVAAFGFGDLPARSSPQDGLLAVVGLVMPAGWFARAVIVAAAAGGAAGAVALARSRGGGAVSGVAAAALTLLNPWAVERLLQGQWSLALAGWLLPAIAWAGLTGRVRACWLLAWPAGLSPSGAVLAGVVAVASCRRRRWATAAVAAALCLPWLVPGLYGVFAGTAATASPESVAAFAPRAEAGLGTPGTLLSLGGIWNAAAAPASRAAGFGIFGLALSALLVAGRRAVAPALAVTAAAGLGVALAAWAVPELYSGALGVLPGGGLARDAHKFAVLALPAAVAGLGGLRRPAAWLALALVLVQAWDFPGALARLRPLDFPPPAVAADIADGRDVLVAGAGTLVDLAGVPTVNPWDKALPTVASGGLVVDGVVVDEPAARKLAAEAAFAAGDRAELERLGVGWVISPRGEVLARTQAPPPGHGAQVAGLALLAVWAAAAPVAASAAGRGTGGRAGRPARGWPGCPGRQAAPARRRRC